MSTAEKIADNVYAKIVFRYGTPILLALTGWLLLGKIEGIDNAIDALTMNNASLQTRVTVLESNATRGRADRELFQAQILARMDKVDDRLNVLSTSVASVAAKVDTLLTQKRADIPAPMLR